MTRDQIISALKAGETDAIDRCVYGLFFGWFATQHMFLGPDARAT